MKYSIDNHVRMVLVWSGMLGFDAYNEAESAILLNEDWATKWDCSDWKLDDLTYVNKWRQEQWDKHEQEYRSAQLLYRYAAIKLLQLNR